MTDLRNFVIREEIPEMKIVDLNKKQKGKGLKMLAPKQMLHSKCR